jgi:hypothetical protein
MSASGKEPVPAPDDNGQVKDYFPDVSDPTAGRVANAREMASAHTSMIADPAPLPSAREGWWFRSDVERVVLGLVDLLGSGSDGNCKNALCRHGHAFGGLCPLGLSNYDGAAELDEGTDHRDRRAAQPTAQPRLTDRFPVRAGS